jgi:hypothetical protein
MPKRPVKSFTAFDRPYVVGQPAPNIPEIRITAISKSTVLNRYRVDFSNGKHVTFEPYEVRDVVE